MRYSLVPRSAVAFRVQEPEDLQADRHNTNFWHLWDVCYACRMPRDEEITFADHLGRFYARRYGFPPMVGRVLAYLLVCEPGDQSIGELSEALLASRSAITGALDVLERLRAVRRSRAAGERMDRVRVDLSSAQSRGFDVSEYQELGVLAREGLEVLRHAFARAAGDAGGIGGVRGLAGRADPGPTR
jgi:DNA-binding transcriptional ArsR family regulator